jgi:pimeloyl-ACP methyl ester carboxylesterase
MASINALDTRAAGEPLVLIHGGGGTWRQWRPVIPFLADHEVLAVNLVGHLGGRPLPADAEASIDALVDGVERDMAARGWSTAHVAGTSLGGWVALELAKRGRARTCTAVAATAGWEKGDRGLRLVGIAYRFLHRAAQIMARDPARWSRRPRLRRLLYWHHFARIDRMDPAETAQLIVGVANCEILPRFLDWAREHGGPSGLDRIGCPVQLLFPSKDLVLPRRRHGDQLIQAMPHAEVHDLPGAGHVATWDEPELVARLIREFTSRHRTGSSDLPPTKVATPLQRH